MQLPAREIGVRIALGARPSDVVAMVRCRGSLLPALRAVGVDSITVIRAE